MDNITFTETEDGGAILSVDLTPEEVKDFASLGLYYVLKEAIEAQEKTLDTTND